MFPSVTIFVLLISAIVKVLVYSQGCTTKKKAAQTSSAIAIANYVWARLITFKRTIIGNAFCCFTPGYSFSYPSKVCSNRNENDPSGSLIRLSLNASLKARDRYPTVSLTVATTSLLFGTCENSAYLAACEKATNTVCLCQRLNMYRKTSLLRKIDSSNLNHLSQARIRLDLVLSTFALAWAVTKAPSR